MWGRLPAAIYISMSTNAAIEQTIQLYGLGIPLRIHRYG